MAACRDRIDMDWHSDDPEMSMACRNICAGCQVRTPCLAEALHACDPWGNWGGLSPDERDVLTGGKNLRMLPPHGENTRYAKHRCRCNACRAAHATYERHRRNRKRLTSRSD
ncbi:hypothetical protein BS329_41570 [Amycolatopsis coloradensis]|uniref:4Fe-4S Wbl-type domain-containing protein n=1 Tax=Amycolatopsis coloradensis TaxID=76021 RepID=A0A1R0KD16_9PSEU|nr:hypothetical protein BS329_41570 [Amycolatopsis coloradensis]